VEEAFLGAVQAVAAGELPFACLGKSRAEVVMQDGGGEAGNLELMAAKLNAEGGLNTK
jgi:hypothetical protein